MEVVTTLPSLPFDAWRALPSISAVYFVLDDDDAVLYVGKATDLRGRWCVHDMIWKGASNGASRIAWLACSPADLAEREAEFMCRLAPTLNVRREVWAGGRFEQSEGVPASVISREFSIPVATVYRMASKGRIPFVDATKDYHERKRYLFNREAVRAALGRTRPPSPGAPAGGKDEGQGA